MSGFPRWEDAAAILLAAQGADWGPIQHKGGLRDRATYRYFWGAAESEGYRHALPAEAEARFFAH